MCFNISKFKWVIYTFLLKTNFETQDNLFHVNLSRDHHPSFHFFYESFYSDRTFDAELKKNINYIKIGPVVQKLHDFQWFPKCLIAAILIRGSLFELT